MVDASVLLFLRDDTVNEIRLSGTEHVAHNSHFSGHFSLRRCILGLLENEPYSRSLDALCHTFCLGSHWHVPVTRRQVVLSLQATGSRDLPSLCSSGCVPFGRVIMINHLHWQSNTNEKVFCTTRRTQTCITPC